MNLGQAYHMICLNSQASLPEEHYGCPVTRCRHDLQAFERGCPMEIPTKEALKAKYNISADDSKLLPPIKEAVRPRAAMPLHVLPALFTGAHSRFSAFSCN
jgi:hypothetical protein